MAATPYGKVLATRENNSLEVIIYETIGGCLALVRYKWDEDHDLGTKDFKKLTAAIAYAELLTTPGAGASDRAARWGELASLWACGSVLWISTEAGRPYQAYEHARRAATEAFAGAPRLRGEPRRKDPRSLGPAAECVCGHELCYHVAVRLPCLVAPCDCRAFRRPVTN